MDVPYGMCHCGCGKPAPVATRTDKGHGWAKGKPKKYIVGHVRRQGPVDFLIDPETGCWVWQRYVMDNGYGQTWDSQNKRHVLAHRASYERERGPIAEGMYLDHLCRNRACVNPAHLEPVTMAENLRRGIQTKLTADDVAEIRASKLLAATLAAHYGVSRHYIHKLREANSRYWK